MRINPIFLGIFAPNDFHRASIQLTISITKQKRHQDLEKHCETEW